MKTDADPRREPTVTSDSRNRWIALVLLCMGSLMIVLDTTIVNVALPSIRSSLGFSQTSLAWVVNAYMLTFGGFLLLGGRLGDHFGHRRLFVAGILLFTAASLACGLSTAKGTLVAARAVQGFGGAIVSAVSLSLIVSLFVEPTDRAKAMGVFGFVAAGGGTLGVLLGGVLTGRARSGTGSSSSTSRSASRSARFLPGCFRQATDRGPAGASTPRAR